MRRIFTAEMINFVMQNAAGKSNMKLAALLNAAYGTSFTQMQIKNLRRRINAPLSGNNGRFKKGCVPFNKGISWKNQCRDEAANKASLSTCFKKGNRPQCALPVGAEVVKSDGYLWRKVEEPNKWKQVHRILWESVNGPVPVGKAVIFLDGNKEHITLDNLFLVSRRELRILNNRGTKTRSEDPQMTKANIGIRRLNERIAKLEERENVKS